MDDEGHTVLSIGPYEFATLGVTRSRHHPASMTSRAPALPAGDLPGPICSRAVCPRAFTRSPLISRCATR